MGWFTGSSPKVMRMPNWTPEQFQLSSQLGGNLSGMMSAGPQYYPEMNKITKLNEPEQQGMGLLERIMSGQDPMTSGAEDLLKQIIAGRPVENLLQPERANRYLGATVRGPIMQRLEEEILPGLEAMAGKGGTYFGTNLMAEKAKAREHAGAEISAAEQNFEQQQIQQQIALEEAERNRQQSAMQMGLQYPLSKIAGAMQAGAAARLPAIYGWQDWSQAQQRQQDIIGQIQAYLKQQPYSFVTTPGQKGVGSSLMGLITALAFA